MARVTYLNLFSESRNNVVSLISNKSNVSDPTNSTAEFRKWIYSRDPDVKASDFKKYPFIIIHPASFSPSETGSSLDRKSNFVSWEIEVEVVTSDRGYGENDGRALSHMDSISDDIMTTLLNATNRQTLAGQSMYFSNPQTTDVVPDVLHNERIYRRSILCSFRSRITVSA